MRDRNVLILSTYYPPANFIAGRRAYGLTKYLPEFGWKPYVITIKWTENTVDSMGIDHMIELTMKKHENIIRVPYQHNRTYPFFNKLWRWRRTLLFPQTAPYDYYKNTMQLFPAILRERNISAVWATFPPAATHLIANKLWNKYNIPWIADFRDFWDQKYISTAYGLFRLRLFMPKLINNCSELTTVSPALVNKLKKITNKNVSCIYNGYDPDEYAALIPHKNHKIFTLVYTGRLIMPDRSPVPVFKAINLLLDTGKISREDFRISFFGNNRILLETLLGNGSVRGVCEIHDPIPHSEISAVQKNSTVLLHLSHPNEQGIMTGKIFEYLSARRPILSVPGDKDCVEKLLKETAAGCCCGNIVDIAEQIKKWYKEWKQSGNVAYAGIDSQIQKYSYVQEAGQVAELLEKSAL